MKINELRAAIEAYCATLSGDPADAVDEYAAPRVRAQRQLDPFADWLQAHADDLGIDQGESDNAFITAAVELDECAQDRARLRRFVAVFDRWLLGRDNNAQLDEARAALDKVEKEGR